MFSPTFHFDPQTLGEVADDPEAAQEYADGLLAEYRGLGNVPGEQKILAPNLIMWLRISGQTSRAEEVARSAFVRVTSGELLELIAKDLPVDYLSLDQISPALRLATALQWNSEPGLEKYELAGKLFDLCVESAQVLAFGTPPVGHGTVLVFAVSLQHRGKYRLAGENLYGALRDINLALSYRIEFEAPQDLIDSSWFGVVSLTNRIETMIQDRNRSIGASIETETFAAGDRSGFGAVASGKRVGPWLFWLKDGRLKAFGQYQDDQLQGPWYWFRAQGGLLQEGAFESNKQSGPWVRYYANGNRLDQGNFEDGVKVGRWTYYNEDGSIKKQTVHKVKK